MFGGVIAFAAMSTFSMTVSAETKTGEGINMFVIGDWGGIPTPPFYTKAQKDVAAAMGKMGDSIGASAVIALGDNFYSDGIATDDTNYRFEKTWLDVYNAPSLALPWYLLAGNHDHHGNVTAQLEYTNHFTSDSDLSWNFPAMYHTQSFRSEGDHPITLDMVFIDTVDLSGNTVGKEGTPEYYAPLPFRPRSAAEDQWAWIEAELEKSTADYLIVSGHYPVYSVCEHGNTQNLIDNLEPMLIKYNVSAYLAGHDHCMSVVKDTLSPVYHIVTGNAHECCTKPEHLNDMPADKDLQWYLAGMRSGVRGGFSTLRVVDLESGLKMEFYDQDGELLYTSDPIAPRWQQRQ